MRTTSNRVLDSREFPYTNEDPKVVARLKDIAQGFSQLQQDRHFADYNLTEPLDPGTLSARSNELWLVKNRTV
jgi:hypothetical protein